MFNSINFLSIVCILFLVVKVIAKTKDINQKTKSDPQNIVSLIELNETITAGPNRKIGFLSPANYHAVANSLPVGNTGVIPVYLSTTAEIEEQVNNGTLVAGMIKGQPLGYFNKFSARVVSAQAMVIRKNPDKYLEQALNAAIVRVIKNGIPLELGRKNEPSIITQLNSCPFSSLSVWPYPTVAELDVEPKERWWAGKSILIGSLIADWKQDGDYMKDSVNPTGYWPDYYNAINDELKLQYPTFEGLKRKYFKSSVMLLAEIELNVSTDPTVYASAVGSTCCAKVGVPDPCYCTNRAVDASEPYFMLDSTYNNRGRTFYFSSTCTTLGGDTTAFTKYYPDITFKVLTDGEIAAIVIGGFCLLIGTIFTAYVIYKERVGRPLFIRLPESEEMVPKNNAARENKEVEI